MRWSIVSLLLSFIPSVCFAAQPGKDGSAPDNISYYKDIRPLFQQHCLGCHQPSKMGGGYNMTTHADLLKKGDRDKVGITPGKPDASFLIELITPRNGKAEMPRSKEPLTDEQIRKITRWVADGAKDDTPASAFAPLVDAEHPPVYEQPPVVNAIAFSPDGKLIAVSGYHEVLLHKADGSELIGRLVGLSERIQSLAFSPDGKYLAVSGGDPGRFGEVQIWDVAKQKLKSSYPVTYDTVYGVSWSPDGTKVAFGCADNTLRAIDASTNQQVLFQGAHSDWVMATVFSQDGQHLLSVSRDRSVKLTEVPTQRFVDNVTSITPGALKGGLLALDLRPVLDPEEIRMNRIATLFNDPNKRLSLLQFIEAAQKVERRMQIVPKDTPGVPPKPYDEILVGGADGQPRLYKIHREVKRVIGDDANKVREYEKLPGRIYTLAFNRTGNWFVVGSSLDGNGEARVYEVDTGKRISTLEGVKTPTYTVAFHPSGKIVAAAGFDGYVRLNDAQSGKLIKEFLPIPLKK